MISCVLCDVRIKSKALAYDWDQGTYHDEDHGIWERDRATTSPRGFHTLHEQGKVIAITLCCRDIERGWTSLNWENPPDLSSNLWSNLGPNSVHALLEETSIPCLRRSCHKDMWFALSPWGSTWAESSGYSLKQLEAAWSSLKWKAHKISHVHLRALRLAHPLQKANSSTLHIPVGWHRVAPCGTVWHRVAPGLQCV